MPLDNINTLFANLAAMVKTGDEVDEKALAAITAGLAIARVVITDLRRIADAQENMARQYVADMAAARAVQK